MPLTRSGDRLAGAPVEGEPSWERGMPGRGVLLVAAIAIGLALVVGLAARGSAPSGAVTPTQVQVQRSSEVLVPPAVHDGAASSTVDGVRSSAWAHLTDLPVDHVADAPLLGVDGRVVVVGARDGRVALTTAAFAPASPLEDPVWRRLPPAPLTARSGPLLAVMGERRRIVVWGGRAGPDGHGEVLDDGALLDADTGVWTPVPPLPGPPGTPPIGTVRDAAVVDGRLLLVAGAGPSLDRTRPVAWQWGPGDVAWAPLPAPPVQSLHGIDVLAVGSRLVASAVVRDEGTRWGDVVTLSYDPAHERWHEHEVVPLQRQHRAAAVALDDRRVALWGRPSTAGGRTTADGLVLDLLTGTWWRLPPPPGGSVRDRTALSVDGVAADGDLAVAGAGLADVLRHNLDERRWSVVAPAPSSGAAGRLAVVGGHILWWGRHPDGEVTLSVLRDPIAQDSASRASAASHSSALPRGW